MKHLVSVQGVTIVSVIHQPRKFIYDLFDSLILLGVGGRMVYHGPTDQAFDYCANLGYVLPPGESVADWLIDISTGRIAAGALLNKDNLEMFRFIDASNTVRVIYDTIFVFFGI